MSILMVTRVSAHAMCGSLSLYDTTAMSAYDYLLWFLSIKIKCI